MTDRRRILGFNGVGILLMAGCGGMGAHNPSPPPPATAGEILYIIQNTTLSTYAIDPASLTPSLVGNPVSILPPSSLLMQIAPAPDGRFLYVLWSDVRQQEHLSSFATNNSGVPQMPAVQALNVSPLSQLNIHPSSTLAYAMEINNSPNGYLSKLILFHIDTSGIVKPDPHVQGTYGPSAYPTLLNGLSSDGTQIYLVSENSNGASYWERTVNEPAGTLGADSLIFEPPSHDSVVLGTTLLVDYQNKLDYSQPQYVNVLSAEPEPPTPLIHCTGKMLAPCAAATNVQFDPSGKYLFITDPISREVRIGEIDTSTRAIDDTGSFLPFTAQTPGFAFSPDGAIVYALLASDHAVHVYRFDLVSGNLAEGNSAVPVSSSGGFLPSVRHE